MGLKRVGRHPGIIPPNLVQKHITRHHALARSVKELEDIGLFLGQADLAVVFGDEHLHRRFERVRPKLEHRVFGLFVLAKLCADTRKQNREFERLGHIVIRPRVKAKDGVGVAIMASQHEDRAFDPLFAHQLAKLAPVRIRQAHVENHEVVKPFLGLHHGLAAVAGFEDIEILGHDKLFGQGLAQVFIIIDKQDFLDLGHIDLPFPCYVMTCGPPACERQELLQFSHGLV